MKCLVILFLLLVFLRNYDLVVLVFVVVLVVVKVLEVMRKRVVLGLELVRVLVMWVLLMLDIK